METLNQRIKQLMNELNLNQVQLAEKMGLSQAAISLLVRGESKSLNSEGLENLHNQCNVNINWLVSGIGSMLIDTQTDEQVKSTAESILHSGLTPTQLEKLIKLADTIC